jgi:hypothetical protein
MGKESAMTTKACNLCGVEKPADEFYPDYRRPGGRQSTCKPCERERRRMWRKTSEKARATARRQIRKPRQRFAIMRVGARQRGIPLTLTLVEYRTLIERLCEYCGGPLPETGGGLDRVDTTEGYHNWNVVPCCAICNGVKHKVFTYDEMKRLGVVIAEIRRERDLSGLPLGHSWDFSPASRDSA